MKLNQNICIKSKNQHNIVFCHDIIYCKAEGSYTQIYLRDMKSFLVSAIIKRIAGKLPEELFVRCHHSYLININEVVSFSRKEAILSTNTKIPISRRKYNNISKRLTSLHTNYL